MQPLHLYYLQVKKQCSSAPAKANGGFTPLIANGAAACHANEQDYNIISTRETEICVRFRRPQTIGESWSKSVMALNKTEIKVYDACEPLTI